MDRYTRGDMSAGEQEEFRRLLESDPQLRSVLDADRLITSALRHDRSAIPADHARLEQHLMSVLQGGPSALPAAAPSAAAALFSAKTVATIVAGIGIVAGSVWFLRSDTGTTVPPPAVPQQVQPAVPPTGETPGRDAGTRGTGGERVLPGSPVRQADGAPARVEKAGKGDARSMGGSTVLSSDSVDVKLKLDRNKLGEPRDH